MKMRAWDVTEKCWIPPVDCAVNFNGNLLTYDMTTDRWSLETIEHELSRSTGLHDKNGKEIYEGDVVSITNPLCQIQKARLIGVVGFSWAAFHVEIKRTVEWELYNVDAPELMFLMNIANSKEIAVIGNIYETPELLTK